MGDYSDQEISKSHSSLRDGSKLKIALTFVSIVFLSITTIGTGMYLQQTEDVTPSESSAATWTINDLSIEYGEAEMVFDHSSQSCEQWDITDAPPRAFIDNSGNIQVIGSHYVTRRFIGTNLNDIKHECNVLLNSDKNSDPTQFNDHEWLHSVYYLDGTIYGLIHNEFHGWEHGPGCANGWPHCWYNAITFAQSTNEGSSYQHTAAPSHLILKYSPDYNPDNNTGIVGFFEPSNIFKKDGYYYFYAFHAEPGITGGSCLFRSTALNNPDSWTYWNGSGFTSVIDHKAPNCTHIPNIGSFVSVTYNTYLEKYIGLRCQWGTCHFSLSDDLVNWEVPRVFGEGKLCMYASILQPGEDSTNFEKTSRSPWIYFMSCANCGSCSDDRDTKRIRMRFTKPGDAGKYELMDLQFSERKGTQSLDASFYGNNASLSGSYSWQKESDSRYFLHLTSGAYGTIAHTPSLSLANTLTIKATIRLSQLPTAGQFATILEKTQPGSPVKRNYGFYVTSDGNLHFSINDGNGYEGTISSGKIAAGQWYDVAVTFDDASNSAIYYINGNVDSTTAISASMAGGQNTAPAIIGGSAFIGNLDSVTLYNYIALQPTCSCTGKTCGIDNGCGVKCTNCPSGQTCNTTNWTCQSSCTPNCTDKVCGDNGCGGSCGTCDAGKTCSPAGQCIFGLVPGDLNGDGRVSVSDYSLFISDYLTYKRDNSLNSRSDFNSDDTISVTDYGLFIKYYLDNL